MRLPDRADGLIAAQITELSTFLVSIGCSCCLVVLTVMMGIKFPWFRRQLRLGTVTQMTATMEANAKKEPSARSTNVPTQGVFKRWDMDETGPPPEPPKVVIRKDRPAPAVPRSQSLPPSSRKTEGRRSEPPPVVPQRTSSTKEDRRKEKLMRKAEEERLKELKRQEIEKRRAEEKAMRKSQKGKKQVSEQPPLPKPKEQVVEAVHPVSSSPSESHAPKLPPKQGPRRLLQTDIDGPSTNEQVPMVEVVNNAHVRATGTSKTENDRVRSKRASEPPKKRAEPDKRMSEPPVERVAATVPADAFVVSGTEAKGKKKDKKKEKKKSKEVLKTAPPSKRNPRAVLASSSSVDSQPAYSVEMPPSPPYAVNEEELFKKMNITGPDSERPVANIVQQSPRPAAKIQSRPRLPAKKKAAAPRPVPVSPPRIYTPPATPPPEYRMETFPRPDQHSLAFENDGILSFRLPDAPEPIEVHPSFLALVHSDESDECDA